MVISTDHVTALDPGHDAVYVKTTDGETVALGAAATSGQARLLAADLAHLIAVAVRSGDPAVLALADGQVVRLDVQAMARPTAKVGA